MARILCSFQIYQPFWIKFWNELFFVIINNDRNVSTSRRSQSNGIYNRTNRTRSNLIEWLKFDCQTQSNLKNQLLSQFSGSIEIQLYLIRFDCIQLLSIEIQLRSIEILLRFDCVWLCLIGSPMFSTTETVSFTFSCLIEFDCVQLVRL